MARKKRNYEEVTNGVSRKIQAETLPAQADGLEERRIESEQLSQPEQRDGLHPIEWSADGELHETNTDTDRGSCTSDAVGFSSDLGRDNRSMGNHQDTGCDTDSGRLLSSDLVGEELAYVETNLHNRNNVPLRSGLGIGHSSEAENGGGGAGDIRNREHSQQLNPSGIPHRNSDSDNGMTTDDCIHAMNVLARFMDVCNAISDHPNADISEIEDCIHAYIDATQRSVNYCYQTLDNLAKRGG